MNSKLTSNFLVPISTIPVKCAKFPGKGKNRQILSDKMLFDNQTLYLKASSYQITGNKRTMVQYQVIRNRIISCYHMINFLITCYLMT
jgi:hypothetical protein